jgi:hypothetical protein
MTDNSKTSIPIEYPLDALNTEKLFYDVEKNLDPINYKVKENSKHEFGIEYEKIIPSAGEIRLLGNRHRDCRYFSLGIDILKYF